ncbi:MAG: 3-hydroxyisobutyryl-CoA hydrolase [Burkholderiales bacterium PBB3]|nr:MAG: 3-hydroxyisobutyryl-CoA hydrolase [Burkholderiales bacterium PBB3]
MIRHSPDVITEVVGSIGCITLNRPKALNALSLPMVQALLDTLQAWKDDAAVIAVAIRGSNKAGQPGSPEALFGAFCAGGDIRFFHQAALEGNADLDTFFTDEYTLNHLIHHYPKPYVAFMDGIVMGGGMGISQGASLRIVTEKTKMAMPETGIGLFPDVGGGYFLSRCPGHVGEYLALTGDVINAEQAVAWSLADVCVPSTELSTLWAELQAQTSAGELEKWVAIKLIASPALSMVSTAELSTEMEAAFTRATIPEILAHLDKADTEASRSAAKTLRHRSPLMLHVVLEQVRRARSMTLAEDLRMERDLVQHCFYTAHLDRSGTSSETVEGIRALAVDKDHQPRWNPAGIEQVTPEMVDPFFVSPWPTGAHPLKDLT